MKVKESDLMSLKSSHTQSKESIVWTELVFPSSTSELDEAKIWKKN